MGTGQELPLLHWTAVNRVLEEVLPDAAVVEQGVSLAGCAVARHRPPLARRVDEKSEQVTLDLEHLAGEAGMAATACAVRPTSSSSSTSFTRAGRLARVLLWARVHA